MKISTTIARMQRRWTPDWYGNLDEPEAERFWFEVRTLSAAERGEWRAQLAAAVHRSFPSLPSADRGAADPSGVADLAARGQQVQDALLDLLCERADLCGMYEDDDTPTPTKRFLQRCATTEQLAELREVIEQGVSGAEKNV